MERQIYFSFGNNRENNFSQDTYPLILNCTGYEVLTMQSQPRLGPREDYYFMLVEQGSLNLSLDGKNGHLDAGELIVIPPHTPYRFTCRDAQGCCYLWMHITGSEPLKYIRWAGLRIGTVIPFPEQKEVNLLFRQMFSLFKNQDELFYMETMGAVIRILAAMGRGASGTPAPEKAVAYLHQHFAKNVTVEQLAQLESKSVSQLRRDFVRKLGKSPKQYLTEIRMRAACHMLRTTRDQIEQIAAECGYEDSHYFCRLFRKEVGCTPSQYRDTPAISQE